MTRPLRILSYGDAPTAGTGFGTVTREVFTPMIRDGFAEVLVHGVNYFGEPHELPFKIWPANVVTGDGDPYGRARFVHRILGGKEEIDLFWFLQDHFTLSWRVPFPDGQQDQFLPGLLARMREQVARGERRDFLAVQYVPVDSDNVLPEFLLWQASRSQPSNRPLLDAVVAYTHFGRRVMLDVVPALNGQVHVIPHGTRPDIFTPLTLEQRIELRRKIFGVGPDVPIVVNVNRNQPRKDVVRTLQVFRRVLDTFPNAMLYLHMNVADPMGFHLERARVNLRIPSGRVIFPANFNEGAGIDWKDLNAVYNCGDVYITTARGEGWGLPVTEAMSAGCPVIAPDHTSYSEILAEGRGALVPCNDRQVLMNDFDQLRPVADAEAMATAVIELLKDGDRRMAIASKALEWARDITWEKVSGTWRTLFEHLMRQKYAPPPFAQREVVPMQQGERPSMFANG